MKTIPIKINFKNHPVHVGVNLIAKVPQWIDNETASRKVAIVTHPELVNLAAPLMEALRDSDYSPSLITIPSGESSKSMDTAMRIIDQLLEHQFERKDTVISFGGGVVGDTAAFAASIYLRGINLIHIPTTLLAQVDSAIGGKTGVNHSKGKNLIGTFYQPLFTVVDFTLLATLPEREIKCGLAEIVKYGIIGNAGLFKYIETHVDKIKACNITRDSDIWAHLITRSVADKAQVVTQDEKESGRREILNFGHTIGHGVEAASGYGRYLHGEAVAIGMIGATRLAETMGFLDSKTAIRIDNLILALGYDTTIDSSVTLSEVMRAMRLDKKVRNGKMRFVLPFGIGDVETVSDIDELMVTEIIEGLYA
ncbi:3-dehydroquinate synthase [bacterium]|nr:3-dehydroquinate synthase [bacterium]